MIIRRTFLVVMLFVIAVPLSAKTDWDVENNHYNPEGCPMAITEIESHWQDFRPPRYNQYGMRLKKALLPGIWCKAHFEVPEEDDGGKEVLGIKFGLWYFNAFDELLGAYTAYATEEKYKPGKEYSVEWLTEDDNLGPTHYRTIIFPYQIRFRDGEWWLADPEEVIAWFIETMDWGEDFEFEELFPEDVFEEFYEEEAMKA